MAALYTGLPGGICMALNCAISNMLDVAPGLHSFK